LDDQSRLVVEMEPDSLNPDFEGITDEERLMDGGACSTFTVDGFSTKLLPSMDVVMAKTKAPGKKPKEADVPKDITPEEEELSRVVTKQGSVIRYLPQGNIEILMPNGNVSRYSPQTNSWIKTRNNGTRQEYKQSGSPTKQRELEDIVILKPL